MKTHWKVLLLAAGSVVPSVFLLAIMRPPGGQSSAPGQDLPWQATAGPDGATVAVFGLTLGQSTVRDAVDKLGRRYELGLFQNPEGRLSLEAYFRDVVLSGLNVRLVLAARLPDPMLAALRGHAGGGKPTADGGRRYPVAEADLGMALGAIVTAITYLPVVKFDADLVRKRFGEPAEQIAAPDGTHWLYPALGLDLLLGDKGQVVMQYVPPAEFVPRLRAPLKRNRGIQAL